MPDPLTPKQRSYCMSQVKGKDTKPEIQVRSALHKRGLRFRKHVRNLPGRPDVVFVSARIAVFIDGDFWHGYQFKEWRHKLSPFWQKKIGDTITRDEHNFQKLISMDWRVLRVWQHQVDNELEDIIDQIYIAVKENGPTPIRNKKRRLNLSLRLCFS